MTHIAAHYSPKNALLLPEDMLTAYGGFTVLPDSSVVILTEKSNLLMSVQRKEMRSFILLGTALAGDGSNLNLNRGHIATTVYQHIQDATLLWCEGAWLNEAGQHVHEESLLLKCPNVTNRMRDITAERLRVEFRQNTIISTNSQGEVMFIS